MSWSFSLIRIVLVFMLAAASLTISGCNHPECAQYSPFVSSDEIRDRLLNWVDSEIFSQTLLQSDLSGSVLLGPGKNRIQSIQGHELDLPRFLYELPFSTAFSGRAPQILLLGEDSSKPIAIFIGRVSFRGLIVSRDQISPTLQRLSLNQKRDFLAIGSRVAIMCYSD